jgi:beta-galactosidase
MQGGNNIFSGKSPICPDRNDIAQWVWASVGTGARKVIYWSTNYRRQSGEAGEWGVFGFKGEDTERSLVTKEINEVLERHGDFFAESKPELSNVTILLSPETQRMLRHIRSNHVGVREWDIMAQIRTSFMWFEALLELGGQPQMRYMSDYEWEKRGKGDAVIIANAAAMPSDIIPRIEKFVERGGRVIIEGLTGFYDEKSYCSTLHNFGLKRLVGGLFEDIRLRETAQHFDIKGIGNIQGHAWLPTVRATATTAAVIGRGADGKAVALHNRLGDGEVWWLTPSISMSCAARNDSAELAKVCKELLGDKVAEQPFRLAKFADGAILRTLRKGEEYITILTNNKRTHCPLQIVAPKGLKATPIFGSAKLSKSGKVTLGDRETLVVHWR